MRCDEVFPRLQSKGLAIRIVDRDTSQEKPSRTGIVPAMLAVCDIAGGFVRFSAITRLRGPWRGNSTRAYEFVLGRK
jgi:hypothetical protein